jgi:hypothetical protein
MTLYFHGSEKLIDGRLFKGTCVSSDKANAVIFARRRSQGKECYLYELLLDPKDLEQKIDEGTVDWVLVRDTPFSKRIPVTADLIAECKAASKANELA